MKILYAIQGTGNGHISCARDIIPLLQKRGKVDILISGTESDIDLPYEIKYRFHGLSFVFGKKGGIDYLKTYKRSNLKKLYKEIKTLPVLDYDVVISDFEPVSSWACYLKNKICIGLSHQIAVTNKNAPKPSKIDLIGNAVLKFYAPASIKFGFHFRSYDKHIFTPVIRKEIRYLQIKNNGHYTVYLPAYSAERIIKLLSSFLKIEWHVFTKNCKAAYEERQISVLPIDNEKFIKSIASAEGVLCGGGFQTPSEVLYLKKKLMIVPMQGQYEQQCNAAALKMLGVPVIKNLKHQQIKKIQKWLDSTATFPISFPDETEEVVETIFKEVEKVRISSQLQNEINSTSKFRRIVLSKFSQLKIN